MIELYSDDELIASVYTDENGIALFEIPDVSYGVLGVKIIAPQTNELVVPESVTPFPDGEHELTITLTYKVSLPVMPF